MKNTVAHSTWLKNYLSKPENALAYINGEIEEGDMFYLLKAIRHVAAANGGMSALAKQTKMSRTSLYKALSDKGNPELATLRKILAVYGIRLGVFAIDRPAARPNTRRPRHGGNYHHL
jgi:probable addiction module antidote protein